MLAFATGRQSRETDGYVEEIEGDTAFLADVRGVLARWTSYTPRAVDFMLVPGWGSVLFNEVTLYALVRALRPAVVVETGGTPGKSTAFILRAMERNAAGHLHTIDLPPPPAGRALGREAWHDHLPDGLGSNWVVPDRLRARHTLLPGRSQDVLPDLLARLGSIDMFFHDSDHSAENMRHEFMTAWPRLRAGGLLIVDDVLANDTFFAFCAARALPHARVYNLATARLPDSR
jgi:methyltransferase family protein